MRRICQLSQVRNALLIVVCCGGLTSCGVKSRTKGFICTFQAEREQQRGHHQRAADLFTEALDAGRQRFSVYYNRGLCFYALQEYDSAVADFDRAIRLKPTFAPAYLAKGVIQVDKQELQEALKSFETAIQLDPNVASYYYNRSLVYYGLGDTDRAINDCNKAIEIDPKHTWSYLQRGMCWVQEGEFDLAVIDLGRVVDADPDCVAAYLFRAAARYRRADYGEAVSDLAEANRLDPELIMPLSMAPGKQPVYIDCRHDQLFHIPVEELRSLTRAELECIAERARGDAARMLRLLTEADVTTNGYRVDLRYALLGQFAVVPVSSNEGCRIDDISEHTPQEWYGRFIGGLDPEQECLFFIVREDSSNVFHLAHQLAWLQGLDVTYASVSSTNAVKFGIAARSSPRPDTDNDH